MQYMQSMLTIQRIYRYASIYRLSVQPSLEKLRIHWPSTSLAVLCSYTAEVADTTEVRAERAKQLELMSFMRNRIPR